MSLDYPIKFQPILKEKIWGGDKLISLLNKDSNKENIGESWEISDVEGDTSVVVNGKHKGKSLKELITEYKGALVGEKVYQEFGSKFPLLIKFIDAKTPLSIQLHPHDDLALKRHNSFGKTEMWYVMQADEKVNLIVGFKEDTTAEEYLHHLENKTLVEILNFDEVKRGDVYFIPTGRIHAIGAGVMLAEIQQTSDITYRVYDWDRIDAEGNSRDLHTDEAIDAIDYNGQKDYSTQYKKEKNKTNSVVDCPYFTTGYIPINGEIKINHNDKDSFVIYMCVNGAVNIIVNSKNTKLNKGETILIPAALKELTISSLENSELLEVYIK